MKGIKIILACLIPFLLCTCSESQTDQTEIRKVEKFSSEWKFIQGDIEDAWKAEFDDTQWQILDLPHDWSISEPYDKNNPGGHGTSFMIGGVGWYRKAFHLPDNLEGKRVEITFDGVYQNSTVWINGHKLGTRPFGYITFKYD
jgi:beta-galactosidase